jgi:hypothetical protein
MNHQLTRRAFAALAGACAIAPGSIIPAFGAARRAQTNSIDQLFPVPESTRFPYVFIGVQLPQRCKSKTRR